MNFGVDGNWYLHRLYHTMPEQSEDPQRLLVKRFVSAVCKDALLVKAKAIAVAFDGSSVFRYKIYPEYKANRTSGDSQVYDYLQPLIDGLAEVGIHVIQFREYEGDDVLASLSLLGPITISTGDKDGYQYLRESVQLLDPTPKVNGKPRPKFTTHKDVERLIGVRADQALDYQTLIGDKIDNVPRLVTPSVARKGLVKHGSLKAWLAEDPKFRTEMRKQKDVLNLNRKLVRMVQDLKVEVKPIRWVSDLESMPRAYVDLHALTSRRTKSLF